VGFKQNTKHETKLEVNNSRISSTFQCCSTLPTSAHARLEWCTSPSKGVSVVLATVHPLRAAHQLNLQHTQR
jgi:hypothetical protein